MLQFGLLVFCATLFLSFAFCVMHTYMRTIVYEDLLPAQNSLTLLFGPVQRTTKRIQAISKTAIYFEAILCSNILSQLFISGERNIMLCAFVCGWSRHYCALYKMLTCESEVELTGPDSLCSGFVLQKCLLHPRKNASMSCKNGFDNKIEKFLQFGNSSFASQISI